MTKLYIDAENMYEEPKHGRVWVVSEYDQNGELSDFSLWSHRKDAVFHANRLKKSMDENPSLYPDFELHVEWEPLHLAADSFDLLTDEKIQLSDEVVSHLNRLRSKLKRKE